MVKVHLLLDTSRNIKTLTDLFETNPYIDEIYAGEQKFTNDALKQLLVGLMGERINSVNKISGADAGIEFQRLVNRVYELTAFPKTPTMPMDSFFEQLKLDINDFELTKPKIYIRETEDREAEKLLKNSRLVSKKIVGVHFNAGMENRQIEPAKIKQIIDRLIAKNYSVVILGTEKDGMVEAGNKSKANQTAEILSAYKNHPFIVWQCNNSGIRQKASIISKLDGMICVDSGMMAVSWLFEIPTIALIGHKAVAGGLLEPKGGYYWAISQRLPFAGHIIHDDPNMQGEAFLAGLDAQLEGQK